MKQRYLDEMQAAKAKSAIGAALEDREASEAPNIFYHSISDRQQLPAAEDLPDEEDPKLEQKLFKLAYRKKFRTKA
jgi:hypothetical protein